jgi:hypothetical protein
MHHLTLMIRVTVIAWFVLLVVPTKPLTGQSSVPVAERENQVFVPLLGELVTIPSSPERLLPPPIKYSTIDMADWMRMAVRHATQVVHIFQDDEQGYVAQMLVWGATADSLWLRKADIDDDGQLELLLSYPHQLTNAADKEALRDSTSDEVFYVVDCFTGFCSRLVLIFEQLDNEYVPVHILSRPVEPGNSLLGSYASSKNYSDPQDMFWLSGEK